MLAHDIHFRRVLVTCFGAFAIALFRTKTGQAGGLQSACTLISYFIVIREQAAFGFGGDARYE